MPASDAAEPVSEPAAPTLHPLSWLLSPLPLPSPPLPAPPLPAPPAPPLLLVTMPPAEVLLEVLVLPPLLLDVLVLPLLEVLDEELLEPPRHSALQLFWRHCAKPTYWLLLLHAVVGLLRQSTHVWLPAQAEAWLQQEPLMQLMHVGSPWNPHAEVMPPDELLELLDVLPPHSVAHSVAQPVLQMQLA
jgi:hypothetical protein